MLVLLLPVSLQARNLASFPGAEGFGTHTPGGRDGRVLFVTSLADTGPGTLRDACLREEPRIIVFAVGGTIDLESDISVREPFCTIAGQTAPGGGICLRAFGLNIFAHDVVVRHLRFRMGVRFVGEDEGFQDCVRVSGKPAPYNVVLDHCSISWGVSRNIITWDGVHDMTVQWCIISEGPRNPDAPQKGLDGMGFLIGDNTKRVSVHHCLFAQNYQRNPRLKHGVAADLVNNIVYNWSDGAAILCGDFERMPDAPPVEFNLVNSSFLRGADTPPEVPVIRALTDTRVFASGNIVEPPFLPAETEPGDLPLTFLDEALDAPPVTVWSATEAFGRVLESAGATLPLRDAVDARVVDGVRNRTGRFIGSENEVGGFPDLSPGSERRDADRDGMPDNWERERGLDPGDPADGAADRDGDGFTNIEEWINGLSPADGGTATE